MVTVCGLYNPFPRFLDRGEQPEVTNQATLEGHVVSAVHVRDLADVVCLVVAIAVLAELDLIAEHPLTSEKPAAIWSSEGGMSPRVTMKLKALNGLLRVAISASVLRSVRLLHRPIWKIHLNSPL